MAAQGGNDAGEISVADLFARMSGEWVGFRPPGDGIEDLAASSASLLAEGWPLGDVVSVLDAGPLSRAEAVAWDALCTSSQYAPQLSMLLSTLFDDSWTEFLFGLVRAAGRVGAAYARHLDAVVADDPERPFADVVRAADALADLVPIAAS